MSFGKCFLVSKLEQNRGKIYQGQNSTPMSFSPFTCDPINHVLSNFIAI